MIAVEWVDIHHPKTGGKARVPKTSLGQHAAAGWRVTEEPKPEPEPTLTPDVSAEETTTEPVVRSRKRRATESEEQ